MENIVLSATSALSRRDTFYLKMYRNTDESLKCFLRWLDIAKMMSADIFVVCDDDNLKHIIEVTTGETLKFITSYRDMSEELFNEIVKRKNCGSALYTPILHAKENQLANFWNIDADDTMLIATLPKCVEILRKVKEYADEQRIDCFSLDMWYSQLYYYHNIMHWSFGIVYTRMEVDYEKAIKEGKEIISRIGYEPMTPNIDCYFSFLKEHNLLRCETFCCENLWFEHIGFGISFWKDGALKYAAKTPWHIPVRKIDAEGVPIAADVVRLNVGLTEENSSLELRKLFIDKTLLYVQTTIPSHSAFLKYSDFLPYILHLFVHSTELIVFITTSDSHTPSNKINKKLSFMKSFGIKTDLQTTYRHSFLCVIDSGIVVLESVASNQKLESSYAFGKHNTVLISRGFNSGNKGNAHGCPVSIEIDNVEYACNKRGLNFVIWDKKSEKVIDSVCFRMRKRYC